MSPAHQVTQRSDYGKPIAAMMLLCLLAASGYALRHTISCFLLSWIIAYLLDPFLVKAEEKGVRRMHALIVMYLLLGICSVFFMAFMVPMITMSWDNMVRDLPAYIRKIEQLALSWKTRLPDGHGAAEMQWLIDKVSGNIDESVKKAGGMAYTFASSILFNIFNIVLSPILVFFMLYYKYDVLEAISSCLPEKHRDVITYIGLEVNSSIGGYLRGQVLVSLIVAGMTTASLYWLEVPHPIFCGVFAGAASALPFIGVVIAILPAVFFAWFKYQTLAIILETVASFAVIYFLEGYIIKPLVFKKSMDLNPLMTIVMVMALGELIGFWGILLALPIAAAMKITWTHVLNGDFRR